MAIFIITAVRTSNPTEFRKFPFEPRTSKQSFTTLTNASKSLMNFRITARNLLNSSDPYWFIFWPNLLPQQNGSATLECR